MAKIELTTLPFVEGLTYWNFKKIEFIRLLTTEKLKNSQKQIVYNAFSDSAIPFWTIAYGNKNSTIEKMEEQFKKEVTNYFSNESYLKDKLYYLVKDNCIIIFCDTEDTALSLLNFFSKDIELIVVEDSITLKARVDYTN